MRVWDNVLEARLEESLGALAERQSPGCVAGAALGLVVAAALVEKAAGDSELDDELAKRVDHLRRAAAEAAGEDARRWEEALPALGELRSISTRAWDDEVGQLVDDLTASQVTVAQIASEIAGCAGAVSVRAERNDALLACVIASELGSAVARSMQFLVASSLNQRGRDALLRKLDLFVESATRATGRARGVQEPEPTQLRWEDMPEEILVASCREDYEQAWVQLRERFERHVLGALQREGVTSGDAANAVEYAFEYAREHSAELPEGHTCRWICSVAFGRAEEL